MQKDLDSEIINFMGRFHWIIEGFSNRVVGLGACSWHSIGQELLGAYKNGDQNIIDFVNNELLKPYAEKYKDKTPDFADFKNYPREAVEFNQFFNTEFYKTYLMFFEGDHSQNHNRFPFLIEKLLGDYSLAKRIDDDDKKDDNEYMAYKKYIFDVIFNFGDNFLEININYDKLFEKLDELRKDKSLDVIIKTNVMAKINDVIDSSIESNLTYTKIVYDFNNNWVLNDKEAYKINQDLLKDEWQSYRIGNILGQAFREHLCDLKKDHEQSKKSGSKTNNDNINKIIDKLPDIKRLEKPFVGVEIDDSNACLALIAQKTGKSSIRFRFNKRDEDVDEKQINQIHIDEYHLYIIDDKTGTVKNYQIKFIENEIHVYDMENIPFIKLGDEKFGKRLLGPEVKDLIDQIKKIQKTKPFCFIGSPGHVENLNHDKEDEFFNRIDKALNFVADNERSKTKDIFCRVGIFFGGLVFTIVLCAMVVTVIPMVIALAVKIYKAIKKKQNEKLSQTQARLYVTRRKVKQNVRTEQLKAYVEKIKKTNNIDVEETKPCLNSLICKQEDLCLQ